MVGRSVVHEAGENCVNFQAMSQVKKVGAGNFVHVLYLYIHDNKMKNPIALKGKDLSIEDNGGSFTTLYVCSPACDISHTV